MFPRPGVTGRRSNSSVAATLSVGYTRKQIRSRTHTINTQRCYLGYVHQKPESSNLQKSIHCGSITQQLKCKTAPLFGTKLYYTNYHRSNKLKIFLNTHPDSNHLTSTCLFLVPRRPHTSKNFMNIHLIHIH